MKIVAIGDFHGKFPQKLARLIKKEKPDLILSNGDYTGIDDWRPLIKKMFRLAARGIDFSISEEMGEKKYTLFLKRDYEAGKIPLRALNSFDTLVFSVWGNGDWYSWEFNDTKYDYLPFVRKLKNFKDINRGIARFKGLKIVGFGGYLDPDIYFTRKGIRAINTTRARTKKRAKRYKRWERELMNLMKSKPDILVAHYTPYKCLDKMKEKGFLLTGSNMGVSSYNRAIKKYKPALVVCGHMHENQGSCKIGKTVIVNPGAASDGKAAIIEMDARKRKVINIRFVR